MLAKNYRLSHRDFLLAKNIGKSINSPEANIVYTPNSVAHMRVAVVTPKKLDKRAVVRNRLRRQVYTTVSAHKTVGLDILFFPKATMLNLSHAELSLKINSLLSKVPGFS